MVSRKMRRGWALALGVGLFSGLVAGCRLMPKSSDAPLHEAPQAAKAREPIDSPAKSDYVTVPGPPVPVVAPASPASASPAPNVARAARCTLPKTTTAAPGAIGMGTSLGTAHGDLDLEPKPGHVTGAFPIKEICVGPVAAAVGEEESSAHKMPEPPLLAALRCYLEKKPYDAIDHLKKFDRLNQELLICLLPLAVQLAETEKPTDRQSAMAVEQLESVMYGMRTRAPLMVEKMCLCKSIRTFGDYEVMPEGHVFQPGEQLRVYAELRNFSSERQECNGTPSVFVTRLASTAEIREGHGDKVVWKQALQRGEPDRSQTPRHDYFDHYRFFLPELRPGWYTLEVTVEDLATHRKARRAVDLKVGLLPQGS